MPLRRSLEEFYTDHGKPEAFRTEGGKAASLSDTASLNVEVSSSPHLPVTHSPRLPVSLFHIRPVAINNSAFRIAAPAAPRIVL